MVWEAAIIRQLLYDAGAVSTKFVPVLFADGSPEYIPTPVRGWSRYVVDTEDGYDGLYRRLAGQPRLLRPALGTIRTLPTRDRRWSEGTRQALSSSAPELSPAPDQGAGVERRRLGRTWRLLQHESNRQVLGWLGGGLVALVVGAWAVFVYLFPPDADQDTHSTATVESRGGVSAGRDINARDITIDHSPEVGSRP